MRRLLFRSIGCSSLLVLGLMPTLQAQTYPPRYEQRFDRGYTRYDGFDRGYNRGASPRMFDRIRVDLDRAQSYAVGGDRFRISRARGQVADVQNAWSAGNFDRRELRQAIVAMEQVIARNRLSEFDRERLRADVYRLQELR